MTRSFLSRETPHFARPIVREGFSPGAGANVAHNLKVLGIGEVSVFSIVGDDWRQTILSDMLTGCDISTERLIVSSERSTTTYIKPILMGYDSQQEDARLDFENDSPLSPELEDSLLATVHQHLPKLDALLIADQLEVNGIVTDRVRNGLNDLAANNPDKHLLADSRQRIGLFRNMTLKPNRFEACLAVCPDRDRRSMQGDELIQVGQTLSHQAGRPAFVTLSEDGVLVCAGETQRSVPAAPVRPPLDPVGAGDAFIAALAAAMAARASPWEAGAVANLAAAVVVEKLHQTGTASPDEILARYHLAEVREAGS
jgi:rfaE bifunctional protein kinase chain/domain